MTLPEAQRNPRSEEAPADSAGASPTADAGPKAGVAVDAVRRLPGRVITLIRWGLVAEFVVAGAAKLLSMPAMVTLFAAVGLGQWFRYATGTWEITGAVLLALPRTSGLGAAALSALMLGAAVTEIVVLRRTPVSSVGTLAALLVIVWSRANT
jgi:putative oxidoreductase